MYRCENCKIVVPANHKLNRVIVETREKSYPVFRTNRRGRRKAVREQVGNAVGFEIAKEMNLCAKCAREITEKVAAARLAAASAPVAASEVVPVAEAAPAPAPEA